MSKKGRCRICGHVGELQKHHYIPQRVKKIEHFVYICQECHKKIHPENGIILTAKFLKEYHKTIKKFIKDNYPEVWEAWQPLREELKKNFKEKIKEVKIPEITDD